MQQPHAEDNLNNFLPWELIFRIHNLRFIDE